MLFSKHHDAVVRDAVKFFLENRTDGARGGKHLDGFRPLFEMLVSESGLADANVHFQSGTVALPGYFRASKRWDVLVTAKNQLIAAIEFKSQVGSTGKNFNNRAEEAIGSAVCLAKTFDKGGLGKTKRHPFLGWLLLIQEDEGLKQKVRNVKPRYPVFSEFDGKGEGLTYLDRYGLLCKNLMEAGLYSSAAVITTNAEATDSGEYSQVSTESSIERFVAAFLRHLSSKI